jgi:hypothetical protein
MLAGVNVWVFHTGIYKKVVEWNVQLLTPRRTKIAGVLSLALWASVVGAGRILNSASMLLPFFEWCEATQLGQAVRDSLWLFPVIESIHLLGLAMLGGALLIVDLRCLGVGLRGQPIAELARDAHPWLVGSLGVMLTTGILLFLSESIRCYYSPPFWLKMELLLAAIVFTFAVRRKVVLADEKRVGPVWGKVVAIVSLGLWFGVGFCGRWIAFY